MRRPDPDDTCGIAQSVGVIGDPWTLLVLRDIVSGRTRFSELLAESGISRKVLTERLAAMVDDGLLIRRAYSSRPPRHEYVLTPRGRGALPVLAALQDFGDAWVLGDGAVTALGDDAGNEKRRMNSLVGQRIPRLASIDPVSHQPVTVVYCYPGNGFPGALQTPGGVGCTLESCTYRDRIGEFEVLGASVVGVSTQTPSEQAEFAAHNRIQFPLMSDAALEFATALRLPVFHVGGTTRLKRLTVIVDAERTVRATIFPIPDVTGSVEAALAAVRTLTR